MVESCSWEADAGEVRGMGGKWKRPEKWREKEGLIEKRRSAFDPRY